ncbi:unnamed protein product [Urochloa humidicola]
MARPHAVVVPYPGAGNINPALQLTKPPPPRHRHHIPVPLGQEAPRELGRDGFCFQAIPDGLSEADRGRQDYGQKPAGVHDHALRDLIVRLNGTLGVPPVVTCVVPTGLMTFARGVTRDLGIPMEAGRKPADDSRTGLRLWK